MPVRLASRVLVVLALIAVLLTVAIATAQTPTPTPGAKSDCDQPTPQPYTGTKVKTQLNDQSFKLRIGRERAGEVSDELEIGTRDDVQMPAKGTSLSGEPVGSMKAVEGEGSGRIRRENIKVGVTQSGGNTLIVDVCVDPKSVKPGRYTGKVLVKGDEIEQFQVATNATVQASGFVGWALLAVAAGLLGFALRTIANLAQLAVKPPKEIGKEAKRLKREVHIGNVWPAYRQDWLVFGASVVLTLIGIGTAYIATYWNNETFGAHNLPDYAKLAGAAFAAATGGATIADMLGALRYKSPDA